MSSLQVVGQNSRTTSSIEPIYERLPRGPHGLGPVAVARHQRMRIHGAMVEAIAAEGYHRTTVKQVIGLAGVSRRAFYEQFTDKRACFLETLDLVAARWCKRVSQACSASKGDLRSRVRAALRAFVEELVANPKSAHLLMVDSEDIGVDGPTRLRRTSLAFERMLGDAFTAGGAPLPPVVLRGIVGGVERITYTHLRSERSSGRGAGEAQSLAREMVRWTMLFDPFAQQRPRGADCAAGDDRDAGAEDIVAPAPIDRRPTGEKARLLHSVLSLALEEQYEDVGPIRIADAAGTSIDTFLELFDSRDACFLAAFDTLGDELLAIAADPSLIGGDWGIAVHRVLGAMMSHLAANPLYAETIATSVYAAGPEAIERNFELARDVASLLIEGAPGGARGRTLQEWIAGAIWQIVQIEGSSGRAKSLPELTDQLALVVLTPFIGAEAASTQIAAAKA